MHFQVILPCGCALIFVRIVVVAVHRNCGLELDPACLSESERVLERHGNMSSATILWVLKAQMASSPVGPVLALAFGPGLTGEGILIAS